MKEWLDLLMHWTWFPLTILATYEGAKQLALNGFGRRQGGLLAFGSMPLLLSVLALLMLNGPSSKLMRSLEELDKGPIIQYSREQFAKLPKAEREEKSSLVAELNYMNRGVLTAYYTSSGKEVLYAPSQAQITQREKQIQEQRLALERMRGHTERIRAEVYASAAAFIAALVIGLVVGRKR